MHKIEKFLDDCIMHLEWTMDQKPINQLDAREKDYISHTCDLALKVMAVLTGKRAYDKYMPDISAPHDSSRMGHMHGTDVNL